ncbi:MAG TPA: AAA family ATPase, partial [Nocardioidaceae bacterium]|nr:AAA family ATPase [Nocardioidaceae bacterium]
LAMRVGIVTGEVAVTIGAEAQGMVAGDAVNTASRVQSVAAPGQVWVDETTRLLTSSAITYVDVGSHQLKGKVEPVPLWAVRAVVAARGGAQRADGLEAPLVGRDRELRLVKELFHSVEEGGRPGLVVVDGDPGVGKSRLAWEFEKYVDGLSTDVRWHSGRCLAYGEGVAFYALADAIRGRLTAASSEYGGAEQAVDTDEPAPERLLEAGLERYVPDPDERTWLRPRMGALLGIGAVGSFEREDLFAAWVTFLERVGVGEETVLLVIDDAQHADEGLLAFLEHLLTVATFPCFVMLLTRPELLDAHPGLATNRRSTVLHLPTLADDDIARLLGGLVAGLPEDLRARLVERAEGVPLFAVETVRSLIDRDLVIPRGGRYVLADTERLDLDTIGAPATLQALVSARLDSLSGEQRRVVDRASVLGGSLRREDLAALCTELTADELDRVLAELVRLQILSRETSRLSSELGQFRFVQSVVRQVASSTLSRRERKALHLQAAAILEGEVSESEDVVPMLAQHYLDALEAVPGDDDVPVLRARAIACLERAAARAAGLGSHKEAAGHLSSALEQAADTAVRARLKCDLATELTHAGSAELAAEHAAEATRIFDELGDEVGAGIAAAAHARSLGELGDNEGGLRLVEPRWEALRGRRDADEALLVLGKEVSSCRGRLGVGVGDTAREWLKVAERTGSDEMIADALVALAIDYGMDGLRSAAMPLMQAGADLARAQHRPMGLVRALVNLTAMLTAEDVARAADSGREALPVALKVGAPTWVLFAQANLALALLEQGAWTELEATCLPESTESESLADAAHVAVRAVIQRARGQAWMLAWVPGSPPAIDDEITIAWQALCEALWAHAEGRLDEAVPLAVKAVETTLAAAGRWDDFPFMWAIATELVVEAGDAASYARLTGLAGEGEERLPLSMAGHQARARALFRMRDRPDAPEVEAGLRAAIDVYQRWGSKVRVARTRADLAEALVAQGRHEEAAPLLEQARATYEQLGATTWLQQLQERLLNAG